MIWAEMVGAIASEVTRFKRLPGDREVRLQAQNFNDLSCHRRAMAMLLALLERHDLRGL